MINILESINDLLNEGYRRRVEVIVMNREGKILQTQIPGYDQNKDYFGFPGGGIEKGDSSEDTCIKETLEEVGVLIDNVRKVNISPFIYNRNDYKWMKNKKRSNYIGTSTTYYVADFIKEDKSILDKNSLNYNWVDIKTAKNNLKYLIDSFLDKDKLLIFKYRLKVLEFVEKNI